MAEGVIVLLLDTLAAWGETPSLSLRLGAGQYIFVEANSFCCSSDVANQMANKHCGLKWHSAISNYNSAPLPYNSDTLPKTVLLQNITVLLQYMTTFLWHITMLLQSCNLTPPAYNWHIIYIISGEGD